MVQPPLAVEEWSKQTQSEGGDDQYGGRWESLCATWEALRGGTITLPDGIQCVFCSDSSCFSSLLSLFSFFPSFFFFLRKSPTTALVPIGRVHASLLWAIKWIRSCLTVQALRTINDNSQNREVKYIYPPGYKYSQNGHRDHLLLLMQDRQSFNPVGQNSGSNNGIVYFCTSACPSPRRNDHWLESSAPDCQKTHPGKWQWWTTGHSRCCCSTRGGAVRRDTRDHACHIWYSAWAYLVEY